MEGENNYSGLQQPDGGYGASTDASGGYSELQSPPSPYANNVAQSVTPMLENGVNLQPSYRNGGDVDLGWGYMDRSKIKTVRIEIEPGQEGNAKRWLTEANSNGFSVIATYHKVQAPLGTDTVSELIAAADWWVKNYPTLQQAGRFTINLMNEWGSHTIAADAFAAAYNQAITKVRSVYDGSVIIDLPGYGQEVHTAALAVGGKGTTISDKAIILSTHIYAEAATDQGSREMRTSDIDELFATGLPCIVGEFGDSANPGNTKWLDLVIYAKSKGLPVLGWAWNGDGGHMNMVTPQFQPFASGQPKQYTKSPYCSTIYNSL
jgi:mannan endo-1,4-beta-mannosidase